MSEPQQYGALLLTRSAAGLTFAFADPAETSLDIAPGLDRILAEKLAELLRDSQSPELSFDLQAQPGISSRQLGLLLAVQKAVRPWRSRLVLLGVHPTVRRLLETTHTAQFFEAK